MSRVLAMLARAEAAEARVATLEAELREAKSDLLRYGRHDSDCPAREYVMVDGIPTTCDCGLDAALAPASDRLPVPEQTTPEPEPDRHPHETMMEAAHAEALPDLLRIANSRRSGHTVGSEPDRCPTCGSDDRNVRGEEGFDVAEGTPYEGQGYIAFGTCSDRWHGAPGGES